MDRNRRNWERPLKKHQPLQLVAAWDALTTKLIEQAGFPAYQVGFALDGMRFGFPDMDVNRLGQKSNAVRERRVEASRGCLPHHCVSGSSLETLLLKSLFSMDKRSEERKQLG
jgi:hypothetical protein